MKKHLLSLAAFLFSFTLVAQELLPNFATPEEEIIINEYLNQKRQQRLVAEPPPFEVRTMAEWEEVQALVITWVGFTEILTEITRAAVNECKVLIVTTNQSGVTEVLEQENIPLDNVEFIQEGFNSIWIRDYGPWTVYGEDVDSLVLVDWIYNRPRPLDDEVPLHVADHLGLEVYEAVAEPYDWVHTGGNHLRDGMGTAFSSDLVFDENPNKSEEEIDEIAQEFLGVDRYIKLPKLPYDGIHHLDMHMRIIDEETIIVGEYPEGVADGPQIEENIQYIKSNFSTAFGNDYRFVRIPMPPDQFDRYPDNGGFYRTFTNSLFINKTIIVPIYEEQYDTVALRIYEENLPGYNVVGIDCNDIIPSLGALHCITKLVGTDDPLWIAHPRLRDTYNTTEDYVTQAIIKHASGISDATLYYRQAQETAYTAVPMSLSDPEQSIWTASIPAQVTGTQIHYYIHATANSGKEQVRPMVAPEGYFEFEVLEVTAAPTANFFAINTEACSSVEVEFKDDSEGFINSYFWEFEGGTPAIANVPNPVVSYAEPGVYSVTLTVGNSVGETTSVLEDYITILDNGQAPFYEGFSDWTAVNWTVENPNQDAAIWALNIDDLCYDEAVYVNNFVTDTRGTSDFMTTRLDLSDLSDVKLSFDVAYAPYNANFFDGLRVNVIDCDGNTTVVYNKFGTDLATADATTEQFVPTCEDWRKEIVDLSSFSGSVEVQFENIGGYGNAVYLDNIDYDGGGLVNSAPSVAITNPQDGMVYLSEFPEITIDIDASDSDGNVQLVELWINGEFYGSTNEAPYSFMYTPSMLGMYEFQAKAIDNLGVETWSGLVTITVDAETNVNLLYQELGISVHPNPVRETLYLGLEDSSADQFRFQLLNSIGQPVQQGQLDLKQATQLELDVRELSAGHYILQIINSEGQSYSVLVEKL